jgi:hypothetical protein
MDKEVAIIRGAETDAGKQRISKSMEQLNTATTNAASALTELWEEIGSRAEFSRMLKHVGFSSREADELTLQVEEAIESRRDASDEFLRAIGGHPPVPPRAPSKTAKAGGVEDFAD